MSRRKAALSNNFTQAETLLSLSSNLAENKPHMTTESEYFCLVIMRSAGA